MSIVIFFFLNCSVVWLTLRSFLFLNFFVLLINLIFSFLYFCWKYMYVCMCVCCMCEFINLINLRKIFISLEILLTTKDKICEKKKIKFRVHSLVVDTIVIYRSLFNANDGFEFLTLSVYLFGCIVSPHFTIHFFKNQTRKNNNRFTLQ